MRENEPVLLIFSVCEEEIILEKGEILSEKRHSSPPPIPKIPLPTKLSNITLSFVIPPSS